MKESKNILRILKETKEAIKKGDVVEIKSLSNQTINTASLAQDPDNIAVAVIVYSLSKILERENYRELPGWKTLYNTILFSLDKSIKDVQENNEEKFRKDFETIRGTISKLSGKLKIYIQDVFRKAQINKASRVYEHGISMAQTAKLLGVSMFELAGYAGQTGISDVPESKTLEVKKRIKIATEIFG